MLIGKICTDIGSSRQRPHLVFRRLFVLVASVAPFLTAIPAFAQQGTPPAPTGVRWENDSIRFGDSVRIEPKIRVQADIPLWNNQEPIDDHFDWGSRRIGVNGALFDRVQFQVERALQDDDDDDTAWRDVYADVRINRALQVRGGRFKLPFSMERNTSRDELDFLQRAAAVRAISPTRDTGVMVHGRVANRVVEYEVGVFQHADGLEVVDDPNAWSALGTALAGRVIVSPIRNNDDGPTRDLQFGAALVRNTVPEGPNGVVGRSFDGERFFDRFNVNGQRTRLGLEGLWQGRRVTLKGEWLQMTDQRLLQSVTAEDLSDLIIRGYYVTGVVRVFGESGRNGQAVDLAARFDRMTLGSGNSSDEPFTNPRADHIAPLAKDTWSFGGNWQLHRWIRIQGNLIREALVDPLGVRDLSSEPVLTAIMRLQFAL
jgi:phosphate-selective porin